MKQCNAKTQPKLTENQNKISQVCQMSQKFFCLVEWGYQLSNLVRLLWMAKIWNRDERLLNYSSPFSVSMINVNHIIRAITRLFKHSWILCVACRKWTDVLVRTRVWPRILATVYRVQTPYYNHSGNQNMIAQNYKPHIVFQPFWPPKYGCTNLIEPNWTSLCFSKTASPLQCSPAVEHWTASHILRRHLWGRQLCSACLRSPRW